MNNEELAIIDLGATIQTLETKEDALACLGSFFDEIDGYKSALVSAHAASDTEKLRSVAHKLKGILGYCSLPAMWVVYEHYHKLLRDEKSRDDERGPAYDALIVEIDRFMEYFPKFKAENET